jgi:hypothetical protein
MINEYENEIATRFLIRYSKCFSSDLHMVCSTGYLMLPDSTFKNTQHLISATMNMGFGSNNKSPKYPTIQLKTGLVAILWVSLRYH